MSPLKWLKKNKTQVMVVVIFVAIIGFIFGAWLQQATRTTAGKRVVAYCYGNKEITNEDIYIARNELEILQKAGAPTMLRSMGIPKFRALDMQTFLLGELLFSEHNTSSEGFNIARQAIRSGGYNITTSQIEGIYNPPPGTGKDILWLLLKKEAEESGIIVTVKDAGRLLAGMVPAIFNNFKYADYVTQLQNLYGISEGQLLNAYVNLIKVLTYSRIVCSNEDVTSSQIKHLVSTDNENIEMEYVKVDAKVFSENQQTPPAEKNTEQFAKYKKYFKGEISQENSYGFGYKLPPRAALEYITLKLDDVEAIVTPPTAEETEEFYQKNREQFVERIPLDPNDPNSPVSEQVKSYAEMANLISKQLLQNKIKSKAEQILWEARNATEQNLKNIDIKSADVTSEQLKEKAGDYKTAAETISNKYKINIYSGKTGPLSPQDMQRDKYLSTLFVQGNLNNAAMLIDVVFAVNELNISQLGPAESLKPKLYENMGPLMQTPKSSDDTTLGDIMTVVRIVEAIPAAEPENIDYKYTKEPFVLTKDANDKKDYTYSVKENVIEDIKKLSAMPIAEQKAQELRELALKDGWDKAIEKFNELYPKKTVKDDEEPNSFTLEVMSQIKQLSSKNLLTLESLASGSPDSEIIDNANKKTAALIDQIYSLVPKDKETPDNMPAIIEFKPDLSYYCFKELTVKHLNEDEYEQMKAFEVYKNEIINTQSMAAVYFNPKNIIDRTIFKIKETEEEKKQKEKTDSNTPLEGKK